jgi:hypothetical protein
MPRSLKFIHVTKTAGTSIEDAAKAKNIYWGRHHSEYGWWHDTLKPAIAHKYDWFMVVRNPYTRILSEYHCRWGGSAAAGRTKEKMNRFLIAKINRARQNRTGDHYTEQYRYLYPGATIHVLKFERLREEFDALMTMYGITGLVLPHENATTKRFQVSDFSRELVDLINTVYDKDFESFGYDKL